jgi:hypothetical protein
MGRLNNIPGKKAVKAFENRNSKCRLPFAVYILNYLTLLAF